MARLPRTRRVIETPSPSRQLAFHQLLVAARKTWLRDGLRETLGKVDPARLKAELSKYAPADAQKILAGAGVRDEEVFPTPIVLEAKPTLIGYYRLLLGLPQKTFYGGSTGMAPFKRMEMKGVLTAAHSEALPAFCEAMGKAMAELVRQLSPSVTSQDVSELPLLTLGSQFQGANNVTIGKQATEDVFLAVAEIVAAHVTKRTEKQLTVKNSAGRTVLITLSHDPDLRVEEDFGGKLRKKVALEIKGGTDRSNAHNRAGEAEKSHQKARNEGFSQFWTVISKKGLDMSKLKKESPTTTAWFDVAQVLGRKGEDWEHLKTMFADAVGIPVIGAVSSSTRGKK